MATLAVLATGCGSAPDAGKQTQGGNVAQVGEALSGAASGQGSSAPGQVRAGQVVPRFECVVEARGHSIAVFGFTNTGTAAANLPVGPKNHFDDQPDHGQPRIFLPGEHPMAFSAELATAQVTWSLAGRSVVANRGGPRCDMNLVDTAVADTGLSQSAPDDNYGTQAAVPVDVEHLMVVNFDRAALKARIGTGRYVRAAELVFDMEPPVGCPAGSGSTTGSTSWSGSLPAGCVTGVSMPELQALAMRRSWTEMGATWRCADDTDTSNRVTDCAEGRPWNLLRNDLAEQNPWYRPDPRGLSLAEWKGRRVHFDVTRELNEFLGAGRWSRALSWVIGGTQASERAVALGTRESQHPPELIVHLDLPVSRQTLPALSFEVDAAVTPGSATYGAPGLSEGHPVGALVDPFGQQTEFIQDELFLSTADPAELQRFLTDWNGQLLASSPSTLPGISPIYLVEIDTARAHPETLAAMLQEVDNRARGVHQASSPEALALLAAGVTELLRGTKVGVNFLSEGASEAIPITDLARNDVEEGPDTTGKGYGSNAFNWPHFSLDPNINSAQFGVADAWKYLFVTHKLNEGQISAVVLDHGFNIPFLTKALPSFDTSNGAATAGAYTDPNACGKGNPCAWHGTDTSQAGFGRPDDRFAAAGPAGPVARVNLHYVTTDGLDLAQQMDRTPRKGLRLMSVSQSGKRPEVFSPLEWYSEATTEQVRDSGVLIFASAGNSSTNVDAETCIDLLLGDLCWEPSRVSPCENDGVLCVGGLQRTGTQRDPQSSYGREDVDLFGPYWVAVGGPTTSAGDGFFLQTGTSVSTPFTAGIAALVMAANTSASADDVEVLLIRYARQSSDPTVTRIVQAREPVIHALGAVGPNGTWVLPPRVDIISPVEGQELTIGEMQRLIAVSMDAFGASLGPVYWSSDVDGELGVGSSLDVWFGTLGPRKITASVTRPSPQRTVADSVNVNVVAPPAPGVLITQPAQDGLVFPPGAPITFQATVTNRTFFDCNDVIWTGDILSPTPPVHGCYVNLTPSKPTSWIAASYQDAYSGEIGVCWRSVSVGTTGGISVVINSPQPGSDGIAYGTCGGTVLLDATVTDPLSTHVNVAWVFTVGTQSYTVATSASATWDTSVQFGGCQGSGALGTLTVYVWDDVEGNVATQSVELGLTGPPV